MTLYGTLNVTLPDSQLNKLKSGIKNGTEVTLSLSSNVIGDSNVEANCPHKFLLSDRQVSRLCKAFPNNSSANIKLWKTQLSKMEQLGGVIRDIPIFGNILSGVAKMGNDIAKNLAKKKLCIRK